MTPSSFAANRLPMDLQTVHMRDFQPYKIEPTQVSSDLSTSASVAFISRSSYQAMYPNWGPADVVRVKRTGLPYRGDSVKLDLKTTYGENYTLSKSALAMKEAPKPPLNRTGTVLKTGPEFYGQTTSMTSFRPFTPDQMAVRATRPVEKPALLTSPLKHFKTTYGVDFVAKKPPVRPPRGAKKLVS